MVTQAAAFTEPEAIYRVDDEASGLVAFVVLHDTSLGPAIGGVRFRGYDSVDAARDDAVELARAMSWKCVFAEIGGGGGKAVVKADDLIDRKAACEVLGDFIDSLGGKFLTAGDLGATRLDLEWIGARTRFIADEEETGDLGYFSGIGLVSAMEALLPLLEVRALRDLRVAVQGLGSIGLGLVRRLLEKGCMPCVADVDPQAVARAQALGPVNVVSADELHRLDVDVLSPCAVGGLIDEGVASALRARAIVGGANRILATPEAGRILWERRVFYAPDFVVNSGALIRGSLAMLRGMPGREDEIERIGRRVGALLEEARRRDRPPEQLAIERAERRIRTARGA